METTVTHEPCSWCEGTGKVLRICYGETPGYVSLLGVVVPVGGVLLPCRCGYCRGTGVVPEGFDYASKG